MKRFAIFAILAILYLKANAQAIAIINDKDGFVNVRKGKSNHSPVVGKIYKGDLFTFYEDGKSGWVNVFQSFENKPGSDLQGYVSANRIFPISKFNSIQSVKAFRDSSIAHNDTLNIVVKASPFRRKNHRLTFSKITAENTKPALTKIDGKTILGTDGELPHKAIADLKIKLNGQFLLIPKSAFNDLYEPGLASLEVYFGRDNTIYIEMDNSDGAGSYSVVWVIRNNKYIKRYIDQVWFNV